MTTPISTTPTTPAWNCVYAVQTHQAGATRIDQSASPCSPQPSVSAFGEPIQADGDAVQTSSNTPAQAVAETVIGWIRDLVDQGRFGDAFRAQFGDEVTSDLARTLEQQIRAGDFSWMPPVSFGQTPGDFAAVLTDQGVAIDGSLADHPEAAASALAGAMPQVLAHVAGLPAPAGVGAVGGFGAAIDPSRNSQLETYLSLPSADGAEVPPQMQMEGLGYTSAPVTSSLVSTANIDRDYVAAWIGTPPEVGQMDDMGIGNLFNPEWRASVVAAARQNGGLGDSENGFLAFSKEYGFVRLRNPRLTPEQNRRLAEMSLTMGVSIDTLPSRTQDSSLSSPDIDKWVNEIVGRYDEQMTQFLADPKDDVVVKDGRKRYVMKLNEEAGRVVSYDYKKHGGFRGFVQSNMDWIGPILDVASVAANFIPGLGQGAALALQGVKTGLTATATGKLTASQVAGFATAFLPGLAEAGTISATQAGAIAGAANAGAQIIDTGSFDAGTLASAVAPSLAAGLGIDASYGQALSSGIGLAADAIANGKLDLNDAFHLAELLASAYDATGSGTSNPVTGQPLAHSGFLDHLKQDLLDALGMDASTAHLVEQFAKPVFNAISRGELRGSDVAQILGSFVGSITDDLETAGLLRAALLTAGHSIDLGTLDPRAAHQWLIPAVRASLASGDPQPRTAA